MIDHRYKIQYGKLNNTKMRQVTIDLSITMKSRKKGYVAGTDRWLERLSFVQTDTKTSALCVVYRKDQNM